MGGRFRGIVAGLLMLVALAAAAYGGWRWGDRVFPPIESRLGLEADSAAAEPVTPEVAQRTIERIDRFRGTGESAEMALGEAEVASVLRYSAPGVVPEGITPPEVELEGGRVHLSTRVALEAFPPVPELERLVGMLPDTVPVELDGSLMPFGEDEAALVVHRVRASGIPVPRRFVPRLLGALGREDRAGLPPDALIVPLPGGLRSAYIHSDSLILVATP